MHHIGSMKKASELFFGFATLCLMGFVLWHMLYVVNMKPVVIPVSTETDNSNLAENIIVKQKEFREKMEATVISRNGQPIEGFEPMMFILALPGLEFRDFNQVEAVIGHYEYVNDELRYNDEETTVLNSAATAVTAEGMDTLLINVAKRLHINLNVASVDDIISLLTKKDTSEEISKTPTSTPVTPITPSKPLPEKPTSPTICPMDAKACPDGSYVARTGPNCEFAACPAYEPKTITCSPAAKQAEACTMEYAPVCASVQVQCITTPCNPVPQTFSNGCMACAQGNVDFYIEGACEMTQEN